MHGFLISETKRTNIFDTKIFTTIALVDAKGDPHQTKCTHKMEFGFTVNQILLTNFPTDFQIPLISTSMNKNKTWDESHLFKTLPSLTQICTPIYAPGHMPHGKITSKPTQSPSNKTLWLSSLFTKYKYQQETITYP